MRGNSYDIRVLLTMLDDKALVQVISNYLKNSSFTKLSEIQLSRSYDEALTGILYPILFERFLALVKATTGNDITPENYKQEAEIW